LIGTLPAQEAPHGRDQGHGQPRGEAQQPGADEELRSFEREYPTRLRSYLESHLRDLVSRGSAEPAAGRQNQHASA
jgi:hypothetical protein